MGTYMCVAVDQEGNSLDVVHCIASGVNDAEVQFAVRSSLCKAEYSKIHNLRVFKLERIFHYQEKEEGMKDQLKLRGPREVSSEQKEE